MKMKPLILALVLSSSSSLFATTMETAPITGDDVKAILELNAEKKKVSFDSPKKITLRCEAWAPGEHKQDFPLKGLTKTVTLMTYVPTSKDGGIIRPLQFWITNNEGAVYSSFVFDSSKVKFVKTEIIEGIYTVVASETPDFNGPLVYRIQILTSDK